MVYTRSRLAGPMGASGSQEGASAASARPLDVPIRDGVSRGQTSATYNCTSSSFRARTLAERYQ